MNRLRRVVVLSAAVVLCSVAAAPAQSGGHHFVDKANGYSVTYPATFKISKGKAAKSETAFGDPGTGKKLVKAEAGSVPLKYHGTYEFNVWKSTAPDAQCGAPAEGEVNGMIPIGPAEDGAARTMNIGGKTFHAYEGNEGGMSKSLTLLGYRAKVNGACWQIQSMTYQVSAFDDYKSFDDKKIRREFMTFLKGFKWL